MIENYEIKLFNKKIYNLIFIIIKNLINSV